MRFVTFLELLNYKDHIITCVGTYGFCLIYTYIKCTLSSFLSVKGPIPTYLLCIHGYKVVDVTGWTPCTKTVGGKSSVIISNCCIVARIVALIPGRTRQVQKCHHRRRTLILDQFIDAVQKFIRHMCGTGFGDTSDCCTLSLGLGCRVGT